MKSAAARRKSRSIILQYGDHPLVFQAGAVFLLALAVQMVWNFLAPSIDPFLRADPLLGDAASYDRIARNLLAGMGFTQRAHQLEAFWPPLYPAFLSLVYRLFGYELMAVRLVQAVFAAFVPLSFFLIAFQSFGQRAAWLTALGLCFYPHLTYFSAWLIAEALFMVLLAIGMLLLSRIRSRPGNALIAAAGITFGLSALAKPFALFVMPFLALWLLLAYPAKEFRTKLLAVLVLAVSTTAVILPWTLRNYRLFDQVVLISTNGGYTFLGANNEHAWGGHDEGYPPSIPGLNDAEQEDAYYEAALDWIRSNPNDFGQLLVVKYRRLFSPLSVASSPTDYELPGSALVYAVYYLFLITAVCGIYLSRASWRDIGFLYAPIAAVILSAGLFYGDARYTSPMVPSLVLFASLVVDFLIRRSQNGRPQAVAQK